VSEILRSNTRLHILDAIRRAGRVARIDLAQTTQVSQATVTTVTAELIKQGLIEETPRTEASGDVRRGRPRVDLKLRADAHMVAGLKVGDASISIVLTDFEGEVVQQHTYPRPDAHVPLVTFIAQIKQALDETLAHAGRVMCDLSGVGVGIAGVVDATRGLVHWTPFFDDRAVNLGAVLRDALQLPVFLDNDANLVAMAEQYLGTAQNNANFIVVTIETGVGLGIVIDNQVYRGARGCGAEFGHTKVQLDGALCRCGQRGCLEAYVADYALLREASFTPRSFREDTPDKTVQALLEAARKGDPTASSIVNRSCRFFAMGLANLVNLFDPERIILSGERMLFDHLYAEDMMTAVTSSIVDVDGKAPEIVIHKWGDFMWARGAAAFALVGVGDIALRGGTDRAA